MVKTLNWTVAHRLRDLYNDSGNTGQVKGFEMWIQRQMEHVSWKDKKTKEDIMALVGEARMFLFNNKEKKALDRTRCSREWFVEDFVDERMVGDKPRGRIRMVIIDDLK
jgi:hypothetical protein